MWIENDKFGNFFFIRKRINYEEKPKNHGKRTTYLLDNLCPVWIWKNIKNYASVLSVMSFSHFEQFLQEFTTLLDWSRISESVWAFWPQNCMMQWITQNCYRSTVLLYIVAGLWTRECDTLSNVCLFGKQTFVFHKNLFLRQGYKLLTILIYSETSL